MSESAGGSGAAFDATVSIVENTEPKPDVRWVDLFGIDPTFTDDEE